MIVMTAMKCGLYMPNLSTSPTYDDQDNSYNQHNNNEVGPSSTVPKNDDRVKYIPVVNPPSWCSPAKGESRLEPIGMTKDAHKAIDLTKKPYYRIGRSPYSTIPLYHTTSSRNHAILYHHPKTNICYVVDNYSIHGTYVDGTRIKPGKEIRIRRGAIVRFGSFGCPTFILKSFNVSVNDLMINLGCVMDSLLNKNDENKDNNSSSSNLIPLKDYNEKLNNSIDQDNKLKNIDEDEKKSSKAKCNNNVQEYFKHAQHWVQQQSSSRRNITTTLKLKVNEISKESSRNNSDNILTCIRGDGGGVACISHEKEIPYASLTLIHTRLNAIGCSTIHDVVYKQNQVQQDYEYANDHNVSNSNKKQECDMIHGYEKFVSLSQLYSSSSDNNEKYETTNASLVGKKRKRGSNLKTPSPPSSPTTNNISSTKYKSILHSVSMDEDCITPNISTTNQQYYRDHNNGNTLPRRRKIRFEDEIINQEQQQQDESFYSYPQVSFELYDNNHNSSS